MRRSWIAVAVLAVAIGATGCGDDSRFGDGTYSIDPDLTADDTSYSSIYTQGVREVCEFVFGGLERRDNCRDIEAQMLMLPLKGVADKAEEEGGDSAYNRILNDGRLNACLYLYGGVCDVKYRSPNDPSSPGVLVVRQ